MLTTAFISYRISCRSNQGSCRRADRQHGRCLGPRQQNPTDPSLKNATVCEQDHSSLSVATYPAIWRPPSSINPELMISSLPAIINQFCSSLVPVLAIETKAVEG